MNDGDGNDAPVEGSVGLLGALEGAVEVLLETTDALRFAEKNLSKRLAMTMLFGGGPG